MTGDLTLVETPHKTPPPKLVLADSTMLNPEADSAVSTEHQLDQIATRVDETIRELNSVYRLIGYTDQEVTEKKNDIFLAIQDTISLFAQSLQREKNNMENECEWLRQQVRIILAMLDDSAGEKTLRTLSRGLVFNDKHLYSEGFKEDALQQLNSYKQSKFYLNSPFNDSLLSDDLSADQQYEYMLAHEREPSLLESKSKLNIIFLDVIKAFVRQFRRFNELTLQFWECVDVIGNVRSSDFLASLPDKNNATEQSLLLNEFESLNQTNLGVRGFKHRSESTYIVSSPRKNCESIETDPADNLKKLREVNYQIVRFIRALRVTKICPSTIQTLAQEVELLEQETHSRATEMKSLIKTGLGLIDVLSLNDDEIKKMQTLRDNNAPEGLFDIDTLQFMEANPREFGLKDDHLQYVQKFVGHLQQLKDSKQRKWDHYSAACIQLWERLGESEVRIQSFLQANSSLTDLSLANFKMELNRLYMKRSEFVENFIADARTDIAELQKAMYYLEEERREFKYYDYDSSHAIEDKELVLNEHEMEVKRLKEEYATKELCFSLYSRVNECITDQKFLIESSKDSSRLLSKNSCKILLNEEKIRKKIQKSMPKLILSLKQEIITLNNARISQNLKPMTVNGHDFFEKVLMIETEYCNQGLGFLNRRPQKRPDVKSPRKSPLKLHKSNTSSPIRKPAQTIAKNRNTARSRLSASPVKATRTASNLLQPLNSPLVMSGQSSQDSTLYSMCMRVSPLRGGAGQQRAETSDVFDDGDKENTSYTKYSMSPIRTDVSRVSNASAFAGDDYRTWREERIREINERS